MNSMKTKVILMLAAVLVGAGAARAEVRHFVAFRFKAAVSAQQRAEVRRRFLELRRSARAADGKPYILAIEAGDADSPEGLDQGMTQGYLVTFRTRADRDYYVGRPKFTPYDPAHDAFKAFVGPLLEADAAGRPGVFVFDYSTGRR